MGSKRKRSDPHLERNPGGGYDLVARTDEASICIVDDLKDRVEAAWRSLQEYSHGFLDYRL